MKHLRYKLSTLLIIVALAAVLFASVDVETMDVDYTQLDGRESHGHQVVLEGLGIQVFCFYGFPASIEMNGITVYGPEQELSNGNAMRNFWWRAGGGL